MRHRAVSTSFNRGQSHRKALLDNMAASVIRHGRITTTVPRAKRARQLTEELITLGRRGDLPARRAAFAVLQDRGLTKRLFADIAPLFAGTNGGYTRLIRLSPRHGDGAELALLELTKVPQPPVTAKPAKVKPASKTAEPAAKHKTEKPHDIKPSRAVEPAQQAKPAQLAQPVKPPHKPQGLLTGLRNIFRRQKPSS